GPQDRRSIGPNDGPGSSHQRAIGNGHPGPGCQYRRRRRRESMRGMLLGASVWLSLGTVTVVEGQDASHGIAGPLAPAYRRLTPTARSLRIRMADTDLPCIPRGPRRSPRFTKDSWESLCSLVQSRRGSMDSVARAAGVSHPGLALVAFFSQRANARFDPQTL